MLKGPTEATLAITGATGAMGGRIAPAWRLWDKARGWSSAMPVVPDLLDAEVAEAAYEDTKALRQALAGARTFFMVSAGETADRARRHAAAVDAAVAAGVERIVYLSFLNAAPDATFTFARDHRRTEEHVRSTVSFTPSCATVPTSTPSPP